MNKAISLVKTFAPSVASLVLPAVVFAQQTPAPPSISSGVPQANITSLQGVLNLLCTVFGWMFWFLVVLAVIFVIVAAFRYLTAAGEPEKVKSAGNTLLYAAVAIGVALLARAVPLVVGSFLGAGNISSC